MHKAPRSGGGVAAVAEVASREAPPTEHECSGDQRHGLVRARGMLGLLGQGTALAQNPEAKARQRPHQRTQAAPSGVKPAAEGRRLENKTRRSTGASKQNAPDGRRHGKNPRRWSRSSLRRISSAAISSRFALATKRVERRKDDVRPMTLLGELYRTARRCRRTRPRRRMLQFAPSRRPNAMFAFGDSACSAPPARTGRSAKWLPPPQARSSAWQPTILRCSTWRANVPQDFGRAAAPARRRQGW